MGERDQLKSGLTEQFAFLTSELGFRGPKVTVRSLLMTLLYRSEAFNLEINAELRDWFLDFHLLPPVQQFNEYGFRLKIRSYDLIKPYFTKEEKTLFDNSAMATAPRGIRGSVPAMLEAAENLAALFRSLIPRLRVQPDPLFKAEPPSSV